jgi:mannose-6-phosphate isomerase-like protein (cupin superfamily)
LARGARTLNRGASAHAPFKPTTRSTRTSTKFREPHMSRKVDVGTAEHYRWGAASEGWHLLRRPDLSVIQERVPPGDAERKHVHARARQFFYVLEGRAVIDVEGGRVELTAGQGLEIPPGTPHQFRNDSPEPVSFLVVSAPPSHGDRTDVD